MTPIKMSELGDLNQWKQLDINWQDLSIRNDLAWCQVHNDIMLHAATMCKIVHGVQFYNDVNTIMQRRDQMFIHCHLYYNLCRPIISDSQWQLWADELRDLQNKYPVKLGFYDEYFVDWDATTGFNLTIPNSYKMLIDTMKPNALI